MEPNKPANYQPILTKLENKSGHKKIYLILGGIILILLVIIVLLVSQKNHGETPAVSKQTDTTKTPAMSETETEDPYAFIYETTAEPSVQRFDDEGNLLADAAFTAAELEKVDKFFGPLPEKQNKTKLAHEKVRGIYVYDPNQLDAYFDAVAGTEVNAFVIDVKESWGILYESKVPLAKEVEAIIDTRNLQGIFKRCHEKGIRVIARIVCFKDATLAEKRPDLCICNEQGVPIEFPLESNSTFASPYNPEVWQYLIDIATEVIELGADEIQFDYVRFPSGGSADGSAAYFGVPEEVPEKFSAINRFLQTAAIEIQDNLQTPVGADLFSIVMTSEIDGLAIGQNFNLIGLTGINNICPMIYPSHYANASLGAQGNGVGSFIGENFYEAPDLHPHDVVIDAIIDGSEAIDQPGYAHIRPYLQAFTAAYLPEGFFMEYNGPEIREQIEATYESGIDEWILWNPNPAYPEGTFMPAGTESKVIPRTNPTADTAETPTSPSSDNSDASQPVSEAGDEPEDEETPEISESGD